MNRLTIFLLIALACVIPDAVDQLLGLAQKHYLLDYQSKKILGYVTFGGYWKHFLFAVCLTSTLYIIEPPHRKVPKQEYVGFAMLVLLIPIVLQYGATIFSAPISAAGISPFTAYLLAHSVFLPEIIQRGLKIDASGAFTATCLLVGYLAGSGYFAQIVPHIGPYLGLFWYSTMGLVLAFFISQDN